MKSILIVEDDRDLRELLTEVFSAALGCPVWSCESVDQVIQHQDRIGDCAVAFLDVDLGRDQPSGLDVFKWLRTHDFHGSIFFLTGHGREHPLVVQASTLGEAEVLRKPYPMENLISRAQRCMA